ncbi:hypothetical protein [Bosea sp. BH3]|uniref:hypothetical protein n=1 Tax=Bosea sp. BH3 TaxID=2871701 RepID=UPI0021CB4812|nr:hypothetical protein [Bosea sp. BH3]MCU4182387.1 hypothetical protein [Bosea sp. BH3]
MPVKPPSQTIHARAHMGKRIRAHDKVAIFTAAGPGASCAVATAVQKDELRLASRAAV